MWTTFNVFFLFWLWCVFITALKLSLVAESGSYSSSSCAGFSLQWLLLTQSPGSRASVVAGHGLSSCSEACGIFLDQDKTGVPCTVKRILNHCTTRQVSLLKSLLNLLQYRSSFMFGFFGPKSCGILAPWPKDLTWGPCIRRGSLNHWTTREVSMPFISADWKKEKKKHSI